jgi:hypothetical protein
MHAAAHRADQSGDGAHQDGLAGAVGADNCDRLAGDLASLQADRVGANVPDNMSDRICIVNRSELRTRHQTGADLRTRRRHPV